MDRFSRLEEAFRNFGIISTFLFTRATYSGIVVKVRRLLGLECGGSHTPIHTVFMLLVSLAIMFIF